MYLTVQTCNNAKYYSIILSALTQLIRKANLTKKIDICHKEKSPSAQWLLKNAIVTLPLDLLRFLHSLFTALWLCLESPPRQPGPADGTAEAAAQLRFPRPPSLPPPPPSPAFAHRHRADQTARRGQHGRCQTRGRLGNYQGDCAGSLRNSDSLAHGSLGEEAAAACRFGISVVQRSDRSYAGGRVQFGCLAF